MISEELARLFLYAACGVLSVYGLLVGASMLPGSDTVALASGLLIFLVFLLWARSQLPIANHPLIQHAGVLALLLLAPLAIPYYLFATRRDRPTPRSVAILLAILAPFLFAIGGAYLAWAVPLPPRYLQLQDGGPWIRVTPATGAHIARQDFAVLTEFVTLERSEGRGMPTDVQDLYHRWYAARPDAYRPPLDPFTGLSYYYERRDTGFVLWSAGPDRKVGTVDDTWFQWPPSPPDSGPGS